MSTRATAFAPASIGNIGVGFDMLGAAVADVGDTVIARRVDETGITIEAITDINGQPHRELSMAAEENTASIAAQALWESYGQGGGVRLRIHKGVPLRSGMGSSAASAVAGAAAVNQLLDRPLAKEKLLPFAIAGEKFASGGLHADNVAPSLLGGIVLCPPVILPETVAITPPRGVSSVLLHPDLEVDTAVARKALAGSYTIEQWLTQQGYLATFIAACEQDDAELLGRCLHDVIIEPQRSLFVPCFKPVKRAAIDAGALGCSLSGSGPAIFALCREDQADDVATLMRAACVDAGFDCRVWVSPLDAPGAKVESVE